MSSQKMESILITVVALVCIVVFAIIIVLLIRGGSDNAEREARAKTVCISEGGIWLNTNNTCVWSQPRVSQ